MPPVSSVRQPEHRLVEWFREGKGRRLAAEAQRQTIPELTRVFGHAGLFLRPFSDYPQELSGNMLASVLTLGRSGDVLRGQWECRDDALPIGTVEDVTLRVTRLRDQNGTVWHVPNGPQSTADLSQAFFQLPSSIMALIALLIASVPAVSPFFSPIP